MKIIDMTCPHCGANLKIDGEKTVAYCEHCGAKLAIDDEVQHVKYDNAEQAGYEFEKGRQRAQAEARKTNNQQARYVQPAQQPVKKRNTLLWVLGWIFFFPAPVMVLIWRKKNKWNVWVKLAVTALFWIVIFAIGSSNDSSESTTPTNSASSETIVAEVEKDNLDQKEQVVDGQTDDAETVIEPVEEIVNAHEALDNFFKLYIDKGRIDNVEDLAKECGVFTNKKNTGTGRFYYKVALTKNDAKAISLDDLTKGDYCIVIDSSGENLTYYKNAELLEIRYSDADGYSIYDKNKLTPFENGTMRLIVGSADEALAYEASVDTEISPIEQFYMEAEIGMSADEVKALLEKYGLVMKYRRANSDDGYISYGGVENNDYGTCIRFVLADELTDLDFYDYYVQQRYGLHTEYVKESEASKRSGDYAEPGYYVIGEETKEHFSTADEAIRYLHEYRNKQ